MSSTGKNLSQYRLFIGNPGAGKSTLANCIAERILFTSGISFGSGKTYGLDKEKHNGIMYLDTPGLADIKMRKAAASAITEALSQNGRYQIFFCGNAKCRKTSTRRLGNNMASTP